MKTARNPGPGPNKVTEKRSIAVAHDEWLIDEAIEETFPASDPTSPSQPAGSLASKYRARKEKPTK